MNKTLVVKIDYFFFRYQISKMSESVYCVFRSYGDKSAIFLAACSTDESARKFCVENGLLTEDIKTPLYMSRAVAAMKCEKSLVIEKIALV